MPDAPLLEIENLSFRYRRATRAALSGVSLRLDPGELLLVAGPSGCGKSTLIRAVNGLIPHSYRGELGGVVRVNGRATGEQRLRELALVVGTVLQDPAKQVVGSTVEGELAFGPENLGMSRAEIAERLAEVSGVAGIGHLLGRTTDALSGGELQQVAVAGALMLRPGLLVLDEPLANLDPLAARRLLVLVRRLADAGTAVILVEHRIEDVLEARPDRVVYMDDGAIVYDGTMDGFLAIADPAAVKVPFEVWLSRAGVRGAPPPAPDVMPRAHDRQAPPRLEWRDVSVAYDGRTVLHGASAALRAHEVVAVLGPNGSGKTTLFKSAIGLVSPLAGEVLVDGSSTADRSVADLAQLFGYVFQNPSQMLFAPTVREELLFGPRNLGRDPAAFDALVSSVLALVHLDGEEGIAQRPPLTLSFGQQKRLSTAVALALRPRTLVLDEPSAGQDHRNAVAFMQEVRRIEGLESVYFVTHDVDLALSNADRVLLLREGRIVADGSPLQVIADRERWLASNLRFTSLMEANLRLRAQTGRFLDGPELAAVVANAPNGGLESQ